MQRVAKFKRSTHRTYSQLYDDIFTEFSATRLDDYRGSIRKRDRRQGFEALVNDLVAFLRQHGDASGSKGRPRTMVDLNELSDDGSEPDEVYDPHRDFRLPGSDSADQRSAAQGSSYYRPPNGSMYSTTFRPPMVSATRPAEPESAHRIRARTRGVPAWAVSEEGEDGVFTDRRTVSSYDATFGSGQPRTDPGEDPALGSAAVASLYCTSIVKDRWLDAVASYLDAISPEERTNFKVEMSALRAFLMPTEKAQAHAWPAAVDRTASAAIVYAYKAKPSMLNATMGQGLDTAGRKKATAVDPDGDRDRSSALAAGEGLRSTGKSMYEVEYDAATLELAPPAAGRTVQSLHLKQSSIPDMPLGRKAEKGHFKTSYGSTFQQKWGHAPPAPRSTNQWQQKTFAV